MSTFSYLIIVDVAATTYMTLSTRACVLLALLSHQQLTLVVFFFHCCIKSIVKLSLFLHVKNVVVN